MPVVLKELLENLTGEEADELIEYLRIVEDARSEIIDFLDDM